MKVLIGALILLSSFIGHAQGNDILAKAAFISAQEYYGNGEFTSAIDKLNQTKKYLGGTNPRVEHMLTLCYAETGEFDKARASLKSYFDGAADSDANYMQMLAMVDQLDKKEKALKTIAEEESLWNKAKAAATHSAYENYFLNYPNGKYIKEARDVYWRLPGPKLIDPRDGREYKTQRLGDLLIMAENIQFEMENSKYDKKLETILYSHAATKTNAICPPGWHLPSVDEIISKGVKVVYPKLNSDWPVVDYRQWILTTIQFDGSLLMDGFTENERFRSNDLKVVLWFSYNGLILQTYDSPPWESFPCRCIQDN